MSGSNNLCVCVCACKNLSLKSQSLWCGNWTKRCFVMTVLSQVIGFQPVGHMAAGAGSPWCPEVWTQWR